MSSVDDVSSSSGTFGSCPTTPFDGSLLSPANISIRGPNALGLSIGPGSESGAYTQLLRQYQRLERDLGREREEHNALKYVTPFLTFQTVLHVIHRLTHNKLSDAHSALMSVYVESTKRPRADDRAPPPDPSPVRTPCMTTEDKNAWSYSRADFPLVNYWTRQQWKDAETCHKDSSNPDIKGGTRGGSRAALGENVMMQYIEHQDGSVIDGSTAAGIRRTARTLWHDFYTRGLAPKTWGKVTREVEERFICEMEKDWPVLRYCEDHWKTRTFATAYYSPWYTPLHRKMQETAHKEAKAKAAQEKENTEPARKKPRTAVEDITEAHSPEHEVQDDRVCSLAPTTPTGDSIGDARSPSRELGEQDGSQGLPSRVASRPRARPLRTLRDPL
jgi:hypothetical protein